MRALPLLLALLLVAGCVPMRATDSLRATAVKDVVVPAAQIEAGEDRHVIRVGGLFGFIDGRGAVVIEPVFEEAAQFSEGLARVRQGGVWGFVLPSGTMAVAPRFVQAADFSAGRARVVLPEAQVSLSSRQAREDDRRFEAFINAAGQVVVEPELIEARDYAEVDGLPLAPVARNITRRLVPLGLRFLMVVAPILESGDGWVVLEGSGDERFRVRGASRVLAYSEGLAAFQQPPSVLRRSHRWGFIDATGAVAIEPRFDVAGSFSEGLAAVAEQGRYGFIDRTGTLVIAARFSQAGAFREGRARVSVDGSWGFIDPAGALVVTPAYDSASDFAEGLAAVGRDGRFGYIRPDGSLALPFEFLSARPFRNGLAYVRTASREGYIDPAGDFVWTPAGN
jgi:hypothetical protein